MRGHGQKGRAAPRVGGVARAPLELDPRPAASVRCASSSRPAARYACAMAARSGALLPSLPREPRASRSARPDRPADSTTPSVRSGPARETRCRCRRWRRWRRATRLPLPHRRATRARRERRPGTGPGSSTHAAGVSSRSQSTARRACREIGGRAPALGEGHDGGAIRQALVPFAEQGGVWLGGSYRRVAGGQRQDHAHQFLLGIARARWQRQRARRQIERAIGLEGSQRLAQLVAPADTPSWILLEQRIEPSSHSIAR